ncbi:single-stranded DNA-binding protein [Lacticaseibacillus saniviri]|uniref:Single-stranded DNA-binding protein n=1 Tax=Lacticaseibacillus saniviri JCM 17471 = DSM 24301 TaxID=1293598 RepID=A0A0R2MVT6_9LACO|nr:single-stranded DNA-binding protein [Lacticaseibacillus saniviri]KRO16482.1 single-stranded DNA-binding protein [Lacticaseibacillus saniviri JCM 17471 = DSM 24301]MCG4282648.1 single-stranded DNA-binding protein [Lacticaseibacillus saniviri]
MINRVVLVGRLTRDVDLRYTQGGAAVGSFTIAVNRQFTNQQGEREADFINCVIWRKSAENFSNFTRKGSLVGVEGRIQTRNYENQQGQRVYVTEVVVDNFSLLESRSTTEARPSEPANNNQNFGNQGFNGQQQAPQSFGNQTSPTSSADQNQTPNSSANGSFNSPDPFANNNGQPIDISDDDLPF